MSRRTILIKNAAIITGCGPAHERGSLLIEDGTITQVGSKARLPKSSSVQVIDAGGRYVLPGFINPHMHFYGAFAMGMPMGRMRSFGQVLEKLWWKLDRALTLEDVRLSALAGAVASLRAGVTTVFDHHASYGAIMGSLGEIATSVEDVGIRASLSFEVSDRNGKRARDAALDENASWIEYVRAACSKNPRFLLRGMVGLHASMTLSDETLSLARSVMDELGAAAHVHVAEGAEDVACTRRKFHTTPVGRFVKAGILRDASIAAHCVHVDARDIRMLAKTGSVVAHNPQSNFNNAVGLAPILRMIHKGVPVAIGTDGMSAGIACDARAAAVVHKVPARDAQAGWDELAFMLWTVAPWLASTAFGMDVGCLSKGAAADVIVMDARPATKLTSENALAHLVFGVLGKPVRTAIVDGRVRMRDFRVKGVDEERLAREACARSKALWRRMK